MAQGGYKIRNPEGIYFITFSVVGWIDVFTRQSYRDVLVQSLTYCQQEKGLQLHAWVIMSNHVHLIVSASSGFNLSSTLRDFKKYTSLKIMMLIENNNYESRKRWMLELFANAAKSNTRNSHRQFWRQDNHPIELTSNHLIDQRLDYLHENPVKAGIVTKPEDYLYSSAADYAGLNGLIKVVLLE